MAQYMESSALRSVGADDVVAGTVGVGVRAGLPGPGLIGAAKDFLQNVTSDDLLAVGRAVPIVGSFIRGYDAASACGLLD